MLHADPELHRGVAVDGLGDIEASPEEALCEEAQASRHRLEKRSESGGG